MGYVRFLVAVLLANVAVGGVAAGGALLAFELAVETIRVQASGAAATEPFGFWRKPPDVHAAMKSWTSRTGTAAAARVLVAMDRMADSRASARFLDLVRLVTEQPTDGEAWLTLAENARDAGYTGAAVAAYDMSVATKRLEPALILERAVYAIRSWDDIDASRRIAALHGLAELKTRLFGKLARTALASAITSVTNKTREEIAAALPSALADDAKLLKAIGL